MQRDFDALRELHPPTAYETSLAPSADRGMWDYMSRLWNNKVLTTQEHDAYLDAYCEGTLKWP